MKDTECCLMIGEALRERKALNRTVKNLATALHPEERLAGPNGV